MNICFITIVVFTKYYSAFGIKNKIMSLFFCKEQRKLAKTQRNWFDVVKNLLLIWKNDSLSQKIKADAKHQPL
jgi:hypothetical protein